MKKFVAFLTLVACIFCFFICANKKKDIVRIHIVAEDNSACAQENKLLVRDKINEFIYPLLSDCNSKDDAILVLSENLDKIEEIANQHSLFGASVTLGEENFPKKTYGNVSYPAGEYSALMVRLGQAQGQNWWCVAFPPMCYSSDNKDEDKVEYRSFFVSLLERLGIL